MASYREIVTKAVIGKGKKDFTNHYQMGSEYKPTTILGCWVINHNFKGSIENNNIIVKGSCDVNIWYSYDNDTKTYVAKDTINYEEILNVTKKRESDTANDEIIVRSLKNPSCTKVEIKEDKIEYDIEKSLGVELVGDTKMRIAVDENEDEWDNLNVKENEQEITSIDEEFLKEEK